MSSTGTDIPHHAPNVNYEHNCVTMLVDYVIDDDQPGDVKFLTREANLSIDSMVPSITLRLSDTVTFSFTLAEFFSALGESARFERP